MSGIKFCPNCRSEQVFMAAGGEIGVWACAICGFRGSIFPEKEKLGVKNDTKTS